MIYDSVKYGADPAKLREYIYCQDCFEPTGNTEDVYGQLCQRCYDNLRHLRNSTKSQEEVRLELLQSMRGTIQALRSALAADRLDLARLREAIKEHDNLENEVANLQEILHGERSEASVLNQKISRLEEAIERIASLMLHEDRARLESAIYDAAQIAREGK
jgi:chromosome segregation ATPase